MSLEMRSLQPVEYLRKHIQTGFRPDGRKLNERRPLSISLGQIKSADGSSIVRQGNTTVVCGIKLEIARPSADTPNEGFIVPNVTLPAMCHPVLKSGPPSTEAQALSTFLKDVIHNSACVEPRELCIVAGKFVWVLYVDVYCLDNDGNLRDACVSALMAAVKSLKLPSTHYDLELDELVVTKDSHVALTTKETTAVACSFCVLDLESPRLIADPSWEEEERSDSQVTLLLSESGDVCLTSQFGSSSLSQEAFQEAITLATSHATSIHQALKALS